jgi:hypothetical protein
MPRFPVGSHVPPPGNFAPIWNVWAWVQTLLKPGLMASVYGLADVPEPLRVRDASVAPVTSLPITPSTSDADEIVTRCVAASKDTVVAPPPANWRTDDPSVTAN